MEAHSHHDPERTGGAEHHSRPKPAGPGRSCDSPAVEPGRCCADRGIGPDRRDGRTAGSALPCVTTQYVTAQQTRPHAAAKPVRWAADVVATMREGARVRLDYSAQSLWRVDRM